jgi:hypothetical protein
LQTGKQGVVMTKLYAKKSGGSKKGGGGRKKC